MSKKSKKSAQVTAASVFIAIGAGLSVNLPSLVHADQHMNPFAAQEIQQSTRPATDGSCGGSDKANDGSCGGSDKANDGSCGGSDKANDGSCGGSQDDPTNKDSVGKCGAGKCG